MIIHFINGKCCNAMFTKLLFVCCLKLRKGISLSKKLQIIYLYDDEIQILKQNFRY